MKIPVGLTIALATLAVIAGLAGAAWWWWKANWQDFDQKTRTVMAEGQKAGASLPESGCLERALARHGESENRSIAGSVQTSLYFRACLDASKPEAKFCDGVPKADETGSRALWSAQRCAAWGFSDYYCPNVASQVVEYCSSPKRAPKT